LLFVFSLSFSNDIVLINRPVSDLDKRNEYPRKLIETALEKTKKDYGRYEIKYARKMQWERSKLMLEEGELIHILHAATRRQWEEDLIPIRIPVMKGILGNRIFLIKKQSQARFNEVKTLEELKKLQAGLGHDWSITSIFKENGFKVVTWSSYEGLFGMLDAERFDYFPRGINEAPVEYLQRKEKYPNLHIEESILVNLPLPVYFFVTPKKPRLARRVERGLNIMIEDGSFDIIFLKFNKDMINGLNLSNRKIFKMVNNDLSAKTPLDRKELWLDLSNPAMLQ
jgi:hypothetical protein